MLKLRPKSLSFIGALLAFVYALSIHVYAQAVQNLSQVHRVYVDSFGSEKDGGAIAARRSVIRHLRGIHEIQIVDNPSDADAVLKGTARIWTIGHASLDPHSRNLLQSIAEGYLSVELVARGQDKNQRTLWSYLVTPGKFAWGSVTDDLARQLANRLLVALKESSQSEPSSGTTTQSSASLKGAGATFPAPLYKKWFEQFQQANPSVHIAYQALGSAEGIQQLQAGEIDFGASEMPLSDQPPSRANLHFTQFPIVLGAVVPIYNVAGLHRNLNFSAEILSGIYLGKIKKWNDPTIRDANPGAALPDSEISVLHRSDGSGTTFVWTDYLSKVSAEWKAKVGRGVTVSWPVGSAAERNEGIAAAVQQTPNSLGYVEFIYAIQHELSFASVRNAAGQFIKANISSVVAAAQTFYSPDSDLRASITDSSGRSAYPIATYTWLLLPEKKENEQKKAALVELLRWMLTSGQKSCSALGYAPLPGDIARRALDLVDRFEKR